MIPGVPAPPTGQPVGVLDRHHRDPFDRLLVAQAKLEDVPILTADPIFTRYPVRTITAA